MGLTIHYSLKLGERGAAADSRARKIIAELRQAALDLPFQGVSELFDLSGEECDFKHRPQDENDPLRWLLIQAEGEVEYDHVTTGGSSRSFRSQRFAPERVIAFEARPGDGCEPANIGLCRYPATVLAHDGRALKTNLPGWRWESFCKTQYASNPKFGDVQNFLRCHLSVVALLDCAKRLGVLDHVSDEGDFWEKRDVADLLKEVGGMNEQIAGLGVLLRRVAGPGLVTEIDKFPNVEQLEAAAQNDPNLAALQKLFATVGAKLRDVLDEQ